MKTPTRKELKEVHKLDREALKLQKQSSDLCDALAKKYAPYNKGDIIEGGLHTRERGVVHSVECWTAEGWGFRLRVYYFPLRGERQLKTTRTFHITKDQKIVLIKAA